MDEVIGNVILKELRAFKSDTDKKFKAIDKRFDAIDERFGANDKRFDAIDKRFEANDKRFDTFEKELAIIKKSTLTMEYELTRKIDILLETRVDANNNYKELSVDVSKLKETTEMHGMEIEFIKNKCASKC